ncbi:conserved hypothetical protein [Candidatus Brocadia pituitae]|nr:conserved hypothetical protein [Candidatus Brocadia pituitae]
MGNINYKDLDMTLTEMEGLVNLAREGVAIATFGGFSNAGRFLVILKDDPQPVIALSTVGLGSEDAGARIVVAFENGDARRPIIIGRLKEQSQQSTPTFKVDGERLVLRAEREIELRCGEASIILTKAGKILIRGNYVLSRSRGANKIKGAFVDIN